MRFILPFKLLYAFNLLKFVRMRISVTKPFWKEIAFPLQQTTTSKRPKDFISTFRMQQEKYKIRFGTVHFTDTIRFVILYSAPHRETRSPPYDRPDSFVHVRGII